MKRLADHLKPWSFFIISVILLSTFFYFDSKTTLYGLFIGLFSFRFKNIYFSKKTILIIIVYVCMLTLLQLAGQDKVVLNRVFFFIFGFLILNTWLKKDFIYFTKIISVFVIILLIGGIIGEFYSFYGLPPLPIHLNLDGSIIALYLSTMATTSYGGLIRASGIFDEAGAFAFVIWITIILRTHFKLNYKINLFLIIIGFITFSFIHTFLSLLYILYYFKKIFTLKIFFIYILLPFNLILTILPILDLSKFEERFQFEDGKFKGDNRTDQVVSFFDNIDINTFIFGDKDILKGTSKFNYSSNPFNPLINNGIFASLPFYILLITLTWSVFTRPDKGLSIIFLLLILQRPYLFVFGYTFLIWIIVFVLYKFKEKLIYEK